MHAWSESDRGVHLSLITCTPCLGSSVVLYMRRDVDRLARFSPAGTGDSGDRGIPPSRNGPSWWEAAVVRREISRRHDGTARRVNRRPCHIHRYEPLVLPTRLYRVTFGSPGSTESIISLPICKSEQTRGGREVGGDPTLFVSDRGGEGSHSSRESRGVRALIRSVFRPSRLRLEALEVRTAEDI